MCVGGSGSGGVVGFRYILGEVDDGLFGGGGMYGNIDLSTGGDDVFDGVSDVCEFDEGDEIWDVSESGSLLDS